MSSSEVKTNEGTKEPVVNGESDAPPAKPRRPRRGPPRRRTRTDSGRKSDSSGGGERAERPERGNRPKGNTSAPSVYIGGLPKSLRVSEFKTEVRGRNVDPLRVVWHGSNGHTFLQFSEMQQALDAIDALKGLEFNGKEMRVDMANSTRRTDDS